MHHYYLYHHRRKDTGEIFYVGISKKNLKRKKGHRTEYERAYAKSKRTSFWKNIIAKTDYTVEIVFESDDLFAVKEQEIRWIKHFGRKCCDRDGTLVNFQEGGEIYTGPKNRNIRIRQSSLTGELIKIWEQLADIEKETSYLKTNIVKCCRKNQHTAYGYLWQYEDDPSFNLKRATSARKKNSNRGKGVILEHRVSKEQLFFRTVEEASKYLNLYKTTVLKYLNKNKKHKIYHISYRPWE